MKKLIIITLGLLVFQACQSENSESEAILHVELEEKLNVTSEAYNPVFKDVESLGSFNNTDFVATLENPINKKHNTIYSATILLAWDEIRKEIKDSIINIESMDLELINNSKSHQNTLRNTEYKSSITVEDSIITAKAYFQKSLPFSSPFKKLNDPIIVKEDSIDCFGFYGHSYDHSRKVDINYYIDEHNFSVTLKPKNKQQEIILIKDEKKHSTFIDYLNAYNAKKNDSKKSANYKSSWRFEFLREDKLKIPIISFNLEHNYKSIENSLFYTNDVLYRVLTFYQKNAFVLNEKGTVVNSIAIEEVSEECATELSEEKPEPKHFVFDSDFVIFLKRKDAEFPYFAIYISNSELLTKFNSSEP